MKTNILTKFNINFKNYIKKRVISYFAAVITIFLLSITFCMRASADAIASYNNDLVKVETVSVRTIIQENPHVLTRVTAARKDIPSPYNAGFSLSNVPAYADSATVEMNNNQPYFGNVTMTTQSYEKYSYFDNRRRCGTAIACVGKDLMPTEKRKSISQIKPSGFKNVKYNGVVEGNYLYNRCHLIAHELSGENANSLNLITGTRYMNIEGMVKFENMVADYVKSTNHHVMYRVTPVFDGDNLVASGVLMEAKSVEDSTICFCIYCYNVQPHVIIDYSNGSSTLDATGQAIYDQTLDEKNNPDKYKSSNITTSAAVATAAATNSSVETVWIPKSGKKYHAKSSCSNMKNPQEVSRADAISRGYEPCKKCYK